jgi:hypothetical protein
MSPGNPNASAFIRVHLRLHLLNTCAQKNRGRNRDPDLSWPLEFEHRTPS